MTGMGHNNDPSPEKLLEAVTDLLLTTRSYQSSADRAYANELAARVITDLPRSHHIKAAEIVSKLSDPPEALLRQLTFLSLEAAQVILQSRHITDAILMEAASKNIDYRRIVARRPQLSEPVVNRLLFFEEIEIENLVLPRTEFPLSSARASRLIDRAEPGSLLASMLARRGNLSPRLSLRLFWKVEGGARQQILQRFNINPIFAAKIFSKVLGPNASGYGKVPFDNIARLIAMAQSTADNASAAKPKDIERLLCDFRGSSNTYNAEKLARIAQISPELAQYIRDDHHGDSFAVLAAALGADEKAMKRLAAIKPVQHGTRSAFSQEDRERIFALGCSLSQPAAVAILSYWDLDLLESKSEKARRDLEMDIQDIKERLSEIAEPEADDTPAEPEEPKPTIEQEAKKSFGIFGRK
jgi:hypothetical protein